MTHGSGQSGGLSPIFSFQHVEIMPVKWQEWFRNDFLLHALPLADLLDRLQGKVVVRARGKKLETADDFPIIDIFCQSIHLPQKPLHVTGG